MASAVSLKEYLKKYQSGDDQNDKKKKKKKKAKDSVSARPLPGGVLIVDEDSVWQKPVNLVEDEAADGAADEEMPVVDEDIEVKRLKRLQLLREQKPYLSISEDGSGWVSVSDKVDGGVDNKLEMTPSVSGNGDLSPPRQRNGGHFQSLSAEPLPRTSRSSSDAMRDASMSPARKSIEDDISPPRRVRHDSPDFEVSRGVSRESDLSPRRKNRKGTSKGTSPPRRTRHDSPELDIFHSTSLNSELSSPRNKRKGSSRNMSPPQRGRNDSPDQEFSHGASHVSDLSPPRKVGKGTSRNKCPPHRAGHHSLVVDVSHDASSNVDSSPPRKNRKCSLDDISPPRRAHYIESDLSPPRKNKNGLEEADLSPPRKHKKAGLLSSGEMKEVIDKKKAEAISRLAALDPVKSGMHAEAVYRHQGKRVTKEEKLKLQKGDEKSKEKKLEWGQGLAQKREAEAKVKELEMEKEKPFARSRDDPELDKMLKEKIRWGDPMAHLVKKKHSNIHLEDLGDDEKMKESGFIIPQAVPNHSWLKRGVDPPPNRYNIRPGRHWDGVDRSSGYEKGLFKRHNEKKASQAEAYIWSVSDM